MEKDFYKGFAGYRANSTTARGRHLNFDDSVPNSSQKKSVLTPSQSFKIFLGILLLLMFVVVFKSFDDFIVNYGSITEREYNTNVLVDDNGIDYTSFDLYNNMTPPLPTFTETLEKLEGLDNVLSTSRFYSDFDEWSKVNTPELYKMKYGNFWQKAVWEVASIFTYLYYNIFIKILAIPNLIKIISALF